MWLKKGQVSPSPILAQWPPSLEVSDLARDCFASLHKSRCLSFTVDRAALASWHWKHYICPLNLSSLTHSKFLICDRLRSRKAHQEPRTKFTLCGQIKSHVTNICVDRKMTDFTVLCFLNRKRSVPFRVPDYSTNERQLLDEIQGHLSTTNSYECVNESVPATPQPHLPQLMASNGLPRDSFSTLGAYGGRRSILTESVNSNKGRAIATEILVS